METDTDKKLQAEIRIPTAEELKNHFLSRAWAIVDVYLDAALGVKEMNSFSADCRQEVWEVVKTLILKSSNSLSLDKVDKPEDVLRAVESGRCTFKEAEQLLELYKKVKDIELGLSSRSSGKGEGVTVNILNAGGESVPLIEVKENEC